jgi:hypothetical protein
MFRDQSTTQPLKKMEQEDLLASGLRLALSAAGPFGAIVAEFLTQFVPNQRVDRLQQFVECLSERLGGLESSFQERISKSSAFAALVEEGAVSAVKTASDEHRRDLAWLLTNGLSHDEARLLETQAILRLRDRITDIQVVLLMSYGNFKRHLGDTEYAAFRAKYPGIFGRMPPTNMSTADQRREWAMSEHYRGELETLGLLRDRDGVAKSGRSPEYEITILGKTLLASIGRYRDPHEKAG